MKRRMTLKYAPFVVERYTLLLRFANSSFVIHLKKTGPPIRSVTCVVRKCNFDARNERLVCVHTAVLYTPCRH